MDTAFAVKEALYNKRKSQTWLAKKIGVTDAYISSVCLGQKTPNVQKLTHIARALEMKLSELVALGEK